MYLEGTCATLTAQECRKRFKYSRRISWEWLKRKIKRELPELYSALSLQFPTLYEAETRSTKTHYIFVHSAIEYFLLK